MQISSHENLQCSSENGEKEDIYQLGIILLEVITGKLVISASDLNETKLQVFNSCHCKKLIPKDPFGVSNIIGVYLLLVFTARKRLSRINIKGRRRTFHSRLICISVTEDRS